MPKVKLSQSGNIAELELFVCPVGIKIGVGNGIYIITPCLFRLTFSVAS